METYMGLGKKCGGAGEEKDEKKGKDAEEKRERRGAIGWRKDYNLRALKIPCMDSLRGFGTKLETCRE